MSFDTDHTPHRTLQLVAVFEAIKGLVVFGAGFGMLALLHRDARRLAEALVTRLHIDRDNHLAGVFLNLASKVTDARLWGFAGLALIYTTVRWAEAYGLWLNRRWAAWLGAASGAIYLPVELWELWHKTTPLKFATLAANLAVVGYLLYTLSAGRGGHAAVPPPHAPGELR